MIVFWILFILIVLISAILAYLSMKDFGESPQDFGADNRLFLIRRSFRLTPDLFLSLHQTIEKAGQILSLERLFKGSKSALLVYGPKKVFEGLISTLDLLELEDYSDKEVGAAAWEMGDSKKLPEQSLFYQFPKLEEDDQVWYQIVLKAQRGKSGLFRGQIRVVVLSQDSKRRKKLSALLQAQKGGLTKIPKAFSSSQIMDFYKKRSIMVGDAIKITTDEIINAIRL